MVETYRLRETARELGELYEELQAMRTSTPPKPEVNGRNRAFESSPPGNWLIMALNDELVRRLHEVGFNAFADIKVKLRDKDTTAINLCGRIAFNADAIARLDWASDLIDELEWQVRIIRLRVDPPETATIRRTERVKRHLKHKFT